jgi:hypothetical protein
MVRFWTGALAVLVCASVLLARDTPAEEYKALEKEYNEAMDAYRAALKDVNTDEERKKLFEEKYPKPDKYAERFLQLAEKNPKDPAAVDALLWVMTHSGMTLLPLGAKPDAPPPAKTPRERALEALLRDHITSDKLAPFAERLGYAHDKESEKQLRLLIEKNPHRDVQGTATVALGRYLKNRTQSARRLDQAETRERMEKAYGKEYVQELLALDLPKIDKEVEQIFERVAEKYADVKHERRGTLGKVAEGELFEIRRLAVGMPAPDIEADDLDGKSFKLSDYRGKVVLLDFWGNW